MEKKRKQSAGLQAETGEKKKPLDPKLARLKSEFLEVSQFQSKRENLLLGEFSSDGKYCLKDEKLMQDLVSMPKVLQERVDNVVYAFTKYNGYNVNFKVELDISESYCSAELFLIEIEHQSEEDVKHLTSLGNYVEIYSPSFKENVYKTWNINLQETPLDKGDAVFRAFKEMDGELNFTKELLEILSQLYIVRLLKVLDGCGTLGLKIQGDYRALVEELIKKDPSLAQNHTRLKHVLDKMIEKHNGFDVILNKSEGAEILKNFSEPIDRVRGKNAPVLVESNSKEEKVPETKTAKKEEPKKKKSKSKGGDSGKPFVWAIKNYKPQVLGDSDEVKKVLPEKPIQAPILDEIVKQIVKKAESEKKADEIKKVSPLPKPAQVENDDHEDDEDIYINGMMEHIETAQQQIVVNEMSNVITGEIEQVEMKDSTEKAAAVQEENAVNEQAENAADEQIGKYANVFEIGGKK